MGLLDTFSFDSDAYARHLGDYSDHELKKKHHEKCSKIASCAVGGGAHLAAAPILGVTLATSAYSFRQMEILNDQKELIEQECGYRNIPLPRERKRDLAIGVAVAIASAGLGDAISVGVDWLSGHPIEEAASTASTTFGDSIHHLSSHSDELANAASHGGDGVVHGIHETIASQAHHLAHHGTVGACELYAPFQYLPSDDAAACMEGFGAGVLGTMEAEELAGNCAGEYVLNSTGRWFAN